MPYITADGLLLVESRERLIHNQRNTSAGILQTITCRGSFIKLPTGSHDSRERSPTHTRRPLMKRFACSIVLSTLIATAAFAADSGSGKIRLDSAVKVGSTELPAGEYKVTWTGSGDNAQVTLKQGKTTATAPAQVVEVRRKSDAFSTKNENGSRELTEIQFHNQTLVLQNAPSQIALKSGCGIGSR